MSSGLVLRLTEKQKYDKRNMNLCMVLLLGGLFCEFSLSIEMYMGTTEYLKDRLPSDLLPFEQLDAKDANGCIAHCSSFNCSSLAFSRMLGKCRLFKHDSLMTPMPPLETDYDSGFQMFYNVSFESNLYHLIYSNLNFTETILSWELPAFG